MRYCTDGAIAIVLNLCCKHFWVLQRKPSLIRLASSFETFAVSNVPTVLAMFKADGMSGPAAMSSPAPAPEPEPNPEPDAAVGIMGAEITQSAQLSQDSDISPADWDTLFYAITQRLQACSGPVSVDHVPEHMLGVTASLQVTVRECAASLSRLHAALVRERQQHQQRHRSE